jgi:glyoxylase-like metal-dependent hydrolase (beta-lactamase superfamily II)
MTLYTVTTLRVGELHLPHNGGIMRDPIHCWLVRGDGVNILVDSGMTDIATVRDRLRIDGTGGGHAILTEKLAAEGLAPGDIHYVVLTHLHFDHAQNLDLFPDACVVVQRDELFHAVDPTPTQRIYYFRETLTELLGRKRPKQLRLVDGDLDLLPGFKLLKTPGHTPAMHVPIVDTAKGRVALVSDLGDHYRYWFPDDPRATDKPQRFMAGAFLPSPIRSESERAFTASMRRVLDQADIVVPAHDFRVPVRIPEQWFACPPSTEGDLAYAPVGAVEKTASEATR